MMLGPIKPPVGNEFRSHKPGEMILPGIGLVAFAILAGYAILFLL